MVDGELCEADRVLPNGRTDYNIDNCGDYDIFRYTCGETTEFPTSDPSSEPSKKPSMDPSSEPSSNPSKDPSSEPSSNPSMDPSSEPSSEPTMDPSSNPSFTTTAPEDEMMSSSGSGSWQVGAFGECSNSCGGGYQVRDVTCSTGMYSDCTDEMPWPYQECNTDECLGPCAETMNDGQGLIDFLADLGYPPFECAQVTDNCDFEQIRNLCAESCCLEDNQVQLNF
eukprot:TRINITY_DN1455_c0_g1_i1.p1 TRINITY_DN1455_c0_g1~~TRINITY_DN1455_c0_g1_i1.p1  ORF type:complete len:225 (-),score=52.35 TRINITY_DN1455_c0_g1_i1:294-968(-)